MCDECGYEEALDKLDDMLLDEDYSFADSTLSGIKEWVQEHEHVTEKQWEAITNIEEAVDV